MFLLRHRSTVYIIPLPHCMYVQLFFNRILYVCCCNTKYVVKSTGTAARWRKINVAILANPKVVNHGLYINFREKCIIEMHKSPPFSSTLTTMQSTQNRFISLLVENSVAFFKTRQTFPFFKIQCENNMEAIDRTIKEYSGNFLLERTFL